MPAVAYPAALLLVAAALTVPLTARTAAAGGDLGFAVVDLVQGACYLAVGVLLRRRGAPGPVPAVLVGIGLCAALSAAANQYALLWRDGAGLPGGVVAQWAQSWLYLPALGLSAIVLPMLLSGRAGRWLPALAGTVIVLDTVALALRPGPLLRDGGLPNPLGVAAAGAVLPVLTVAGALLLSAGPVLLWRARRAGGDPSLSWFLTGTVLLAAALLADLLAGVAPYPPAFGWSLHLATLPLLPGAVLAVALRREPGRLRAAVRRALEWSLLPLGLTWAFLTVVAWLGVVLHGHAGTWATVAAAGLVAIAFEPARAWLHRATGRLFGGYRRDPLAVLRDVTAELSGPPGPGEVWRRVAAVTTTRLRLAGVTVEPGAGEPAAHAGRTGGEPVVIALRHGAEPPGRLLVHPRAGDRLTTADLELLHQVAHLMAAEMATRRARTALAQARTAERHRLGRDLHDDLGPALAGISLGLTAAANKVTAGNAGDLAPLLDALGRESVAAAAEVRRIAHDLRPPWLSDGGLLTGLRAHVSGLRRAGGPEITLTAPGDLPDLPEVVQVTAYRVAVEALTNTVRHAGAARCAIVVSAGAELAVDVTDDGRGVDAAAAAGAGLATMRARAAELGGTFDIGPGPRGAGTVVRLRLPLAAHR